MSGLGWLFQAFYQLRRHFLLGLRADRWLLLVLASTAAYAVLRGVATRTWIPAALAAAVHALGWVSHKARFVVFRSEQSILPTSLAALRSADTELHLWASGRFSVHEQTRDLANQPASYTTPRSREHIIMTLLQPTRRLLLARSPADDWGWWYIFIKPDELVSATPGRQYCGWRARPALKLDHLTENDKGELIPAVTTLAFDCEPSRALVWEDLTRDKR
jgi:hypothetical protein